MEKTDVNFCIEIRDVWYRYPGNGDEIIKGINATVGQGELIGITGAAGAGKSTLARLMAGVLLPFRGQILVGGLNTAGDKTREQIRFHIGIVFQNPDNQIVAARVEEDVAFGPENLNLPPSEVRRRVHDAIETVGIGHLRERSPHLLSGGEKQLLTIAGAIALWPSCLILDEPASMLNPSSRHNIFKVLRKLAEKGITVIVVTSALDEWFQFNRLWIVDEGKLIYDGAPPQGPGYPDRISDLSIMPGKTAELSFELKARGIDVPLGTVTIDEMVSFICRALK